MKINLFIQTINNNSQRKYYPNLRPLTKDTVSFSAMKKNQFSGIDLMMINRLKAPIEKFNSNVDFQTWCKKIVESNYISKKDEISDSVDEQAKLQKKKILNDWIEYIIVENEAYTPAIQLMILSSITSDLNKDTNYLPPILDKRILADTIYEIEEKCKKDRNFNCNFNKIYRNNLQKGMIKNETNLDKCLSGWVIIPSKKKDPIHFEENVKKLQTLSHDNWCTKTYNAEPYLANGDFHIYMEEGKPKLGVRFSGNSVTEIQGGKNDTKIPLKYLDIVKTYFHENKIKLSNNSKEELEQAERVKTKSDAIKRNISEQNLDLNTCNSKVIFDLVGFKYEENEEGKLILEKYSQPDKDCTWEDIGIEENKLFENIIEISGNADFNGSNATDLGSLEKIGGNAYFSDSILNDLGNLKEIGRDAWFGNSKIINLGSLTKIGRNANFENSKITDLGSLEAIIGNADFRYSVLKDLGKLRTIGGFADFRYSEIMDLGNLEVIKGRAYFEKSKIKSLSKLKSILGDAFFKDSQVVDLGDLEKIGGNADFERSQMTNLGKLKSIGGNVWFFNSEINNLGMVEIIGGDANFEHSKVSSLGKLKSILGSAFFSFSKITDLANLESIGRSAVFQCSDVISLGELKTIGNNAIFRNSKITCLGKLKSILGDAYFDCSQVTDLGELEIIGGKAYFYDSQIKSLGKLKSINGKSIGNAKTPKDLDLLLC